MQEERDHLATRVFPELRHRCRQRQVEFVEVDLRWGITEEQANRGEVLPTCLAEIENCRPYFIGLLGERYGWVPDFIHPELINEQPWLQEHKEKSVTELEILHGVLNNPAMADRSFFYFRDPAYPEAVPQERRGDFLTEDDVSKARLEKLKERIRKSSLPLRENYPDPEAVGKLILDDLWTAIDKAFPEDQPPDPLDQEAAEHEAFAQSRAKVYIAREEYYQRLDEHAAAEEGPPLCLKGESGGGKSALLANWAFRYRQAHPDVFLIMHFIGSSPGSTDYVAIIRRIMGEIKRRYDVPDEIPAAPDKIKEAFPFWLAIASAKGGMVLILDALNQLDDRDRAQHLVWLPDYIPPKVRLVVSALPGPALDETEKRGYQTLPVAPLGPEEVEKLAIDYLAQYRKTLDKEQIKRIADATATTNPLYLRALLEELRIFGIYEELDSRIDHYLQAKSVPDLYDKILERLEEDYEEDREDLVGDAMSFLWASRRGLYESELLELLGDSDQPLPRAVWSPPFLALQESLISRSGLVNFFHDYLRQAVENRYLPKPDSHRAWHIWLADYFDTRDTDERKADELPWQLCHAQEWERLGYCVTDIPLFLVLVGEKTKYELMGYWLALPKTYDVVRWYYAAITSYESSRPSAEALSSALNAVAFFLDLNARYDGAESLYRRALKIREQVLGLEHPDVAGVLNNLAGLLHDKGDYDGAESLYRRALEIREMALGGEHPKTTGILNNLAELLRDKGDYDAAETLYRRVLETDEKVLGPEHPDTATCLNNLALLLHSQGDYERAEPMHRRALEIREKVLGADHPDTAQSLNNLALLLRSQGHYNEAERLNRRALRIRARVQGPYHPDTATSLNNLAFVLEAKGDFERAERLYREAQEIWEKAVGTVHPKTATSVNNLAQVLRAKGNYDGAEPLYHKSLEMREKVLGAEHPDTVQSLNNLARLLYLKGDYDGAEPLYRRALEIRDKVLGRDHPDTAQNLNDLALLLWAKDDYDGAEPLYRRALKIQEKILGVAHPYTATTMNNLALLLEDMGDCEGAELLYRRAFETYENVLGAEHPDTAQSINNLAGLLCSKGDYDAAEPLFRRALAIREKTLGADHPDTAQNLNNLASLLEAKGDYEGAEPLYRRALEIWERVLGLGHPHTRVAAKNLGKLLRAVEDEEGLAELQKRFPGVI
jgi:tetratricopeptide (TPR) repeat protein